MKILIIKGHLDRELYDQAFAVSYRKPVISSGAEVQVVNIRELTFNPNIKRRPI